MNRRLQQIPKPLLIFYALVIYVFLQFSWWSYLLFDLNDQVIYLEGQLELAGGTSTDHKAMLQRLSQKRLMILGEGLVFLILLALGVLQTRKSFKRESRLATQQHNFLLSVTHELKTPVASLKLFLQTIQKRELPREKLMELAERAQEESRRLDHLVENILLINRMESPEFRLHMEEVNLSALTGDLIGKFKMGQLPEGLQLSVDAEPDLKIYADQQALQSIVFNLLENAVKYAVGGNLIKVSVEANRTDVVLCVIDYGPGIRNVEKERIFTRFFRAGNEETRSSKGTGLGLFIVRNLVDAMQGKIYLKDNQPSGCIFEVRFKRLE